MRYLRQALLLLLILALCLPFAACTGAGDAETTAADEITAADETTVSDDTTADDETTVPDDTTTGELPTDDIGCEHPTEEDTTAPGPEEDDVLLSTFAQMQIVFEAEGGDAYLKQAERVRDALRDTCGVTLRISPDTFKAEEEYEIQIGACKDRATATDVNALRVDDYFISFGGKQLTVGCGSIEALTSAVDALVAVIEAYEENVNGVLCKEADLALSRTGEYNLDAITLGDIPVAELAIVYPRQATFFEDDYAEEIAAVIRELSGYRVRVYKDNETPNASHVLHVGVTAALPENYVPFADEDSDAYAIERVENGVALVALNPISLRAGKDALLSMLNADAAVDGTLALPLTERIEAVGEDTSLRAMSFNVSNANVTEERMALVVEMIRKHDPDLLGLQEVTAEWKSYLILQLGDVYDFVGEGCDGQNSGDMCAIMYRKSEFRLIDSDTFWLTNTPDRVSKHAKASKNAIMTYVILERLSDGMQIMHANTQLDQSDSGAAEAQAEVILSLTGRWGDLPTFLTGDFNWAPNSWPLHKLKNGYFRNPSEISCVRDPATTSPAGIVADYCLIRDSITALYYRVDTEKTEVDGVADATSPSDRCPVVIDVWINPDEPAEDTESAE